MFPLYDHTRRQICMAAFLGLCVLPTLAVAGWSIARHLPWHKQAEEATPRPGTGARCLDRVDGAHAARRRAVRGTEAHRSGNRPGVAPLQRTDRHVDLDDRFARADPPGNRAGGHAGRIGDQRLGAARRSAAPPAGVPGRPAGDRSPRDRRPVDAA